MASRLISAILWTLVSVNVITLVVGGLITWLGYAIPVRLTQFGLLPELVIVAGFASLVVACIGLCALNYSSYHALNIYGISCSIFALMLVLGIPENWYKSSHFVDGGLLRDTLYFTLLSILLVLLVFSFTFAQYLRKRELAQLELHQHQHQRHQNSGAGDQLLDSSCNSPICTCNLPIKSIGGGCSGGFDEATVLMSNNSNSIGADKWFPWTSSGCAAAARQRNNNHIMGELSSGGLNFRQANNSSYHTGACHLSDLRVPFTYRNDINSSSTNTQTINTNTNNNNKSKSSSNSNSNSISNSQSNNNINGNAQCCTRANNISSSSSSNTAAPALSAILDERGLIDKYGPLIHKGYYQRVNGNETNTGGALVRAKSFSRPLLDESSELIEDRQGVADGLNRANWVANSSNLGASNNQKLHRSASNLCVATRDDSLVQYGRQQQLPPLPFMGGRQSAMSDWPMDSNVAALTAQYATATLGKCSCYPGSEARVDQMAHLTTTLPTRKVSCNNRQHHNYHSHQQHQQLQLQQSHRHHHHLHHHHHHHKHGLHHQTAASALTAPRFNNSTSIYAIRGSGRSAQQQQTKSRTKGSSSVVAMTAAAAAALFGGVADTGLLTTPDNGIGDDGIFTGPADADEALLVDADRHYADFDNNDHQLGVSMLNTPVAVANVTNSSIIDNHKTLHQNVWDRPTFGLASLL